MQIKSVWVFRRFYTLAFLLLGSTSAAAEEWHISEDNSALTGATTITATQPSTRPLANMLGYPERATFVISCSGTVLSTYVIWPQVLSIDVTDPLTNAPQTTVLWKVDAGKIAVNFWNISSEGTAAGKFNTGGAIKIVDKLAGAHQLVVQLTGRTSQEAVFNLSEAAPIFERLTAACGVKGRITH